MSQLFTTYPRTLLYLGGTTGFVTQNHSDDTCQIKMLMKIQQLHMYIEKISVRICYTFRNIYFKAVYYPEEQRWNHREFL